MQESVSDRKSNGSWNPILPKVLAGDISAAAISATIISPLVTAIDRAVVENAASKRPLLKTVISHALCSVRHPRLFFNAKPFFYVWTLYATTYTVANSTETLARTFMDKADQVAIGSVTFLSTIIFNVPLGVWKDVRFVQIYGNYKAPPNPIVASAKTSGSPSPALKLASATASKSAPKPPPPPKPKSPAPLQPGFPKAAAAAFLFRDAITILGSFTLPPMVSAAIPGSENWDPKVKMATSQLFVPVLSQVFATPIHLLGLDLYTYPRMSQNAGRASRITENLGPTTVMRCCRIIPAFGVGLVVNTGLRDAFHEKVGSEDTIVKV